MKHFLSLLFSSIFIFIFTSYVFCGDVWELVTGIKDTDLKEVNIDYSNKGVIYVTGAKTLYRTDDNGRTWLSVFSSQASDDMINFIRVFEQGVFMCTKNGVFASNDGKLNWKKIFKGIGDKENNVSHIAFSKDKKIYIATDSGLFISNDNGVTWSKDSLEGAGDSVKWVEFLDEIIFIATEKGVYKNSGAGWKRTFVTRREDAEYDVNIADESLWALKPVNSIAINKDIMFLATDSGIFISEDKGETWKSFINTGLISLHVKRILFVDILYAITDKGVFVFSDKDKLWQSLYKGMATKEASSMAVDSDGNIWVTTKKGLYERRRNMIIKLTPNDNLENEKQDILKKFEGEPAINDVQKAAVEYAEVHPDKIKGWRDAAKKKALFPNVSVGLDRYVTDLLHWDSGTNPDTLQKGKDAVSWDIAMTWDMGELIWNKIRCIPIKSQSMFLILTQIRSILI